MSKSDQKNAVYRVTEVVGTSQVSWEDAVKNAVQVASKSLRDLRIAEVVKLDVKIEDGKVTTFALASRSHSNTKLDHEP